MDQAFWHDRWQRQDIGFHQAQVHAQLLACWPRVSAASDSAVFVPLAGKSRDMTWLAEQGHRVVGVELSEIAIRQFFDEAGLVPNVHSEGAHDVWVCGPFTIWRGDIFQLQRTALANVSAIYDRAALIALPPDMRARYAQTLRDILPASARGLLIAVDYPPGELEGPPFAVPPTTVRALFSDGFEIDVLDERDGLAASGNLRQRGVTRLDETAYLLSPHP